MPSTTLPGESPYHAKGWTIVRLKEELRNRNLSPAGNKADLIARLELHDSNEHSTYSAILMVRSPSGRLPVRLAGRISKVHTPPQATEAPMRKRTQKSPVRLNQETSDQENEGSSLGLFGKSSTSES